MKTVIFIILLIISLITNIVLLFKFNKIKYILNQSKWWALLKKISKNYIFNLLINGLVIGTITGYIVTFLFTIPSISVINSWVSFSDEKCHIKIAIENTGSASAKNIVATTFLNFKESSPPLYEICPDTTILLYPGDKLSINTVRLLPKNDKRNLILFLYIKYEDSNKLRQFINQFILGKKYYKVKKWLTIDPEKSSLAPYVSLNNSKIERQLIKDFDSRSQDNLKTRHILHYE